MGSSMAHEDGELRFSEGESVAGVEIVREVARGGMAIVYEARGADGRAVALKVGTAEAAKDQTEARFRNEARLGAALRHPNVVRPLQVGCLSEPRGFEGRMYLVTELVRGRSLADELMFHARGMPWEQVSAVARQLCSALVEMHRHGVVHRDLKPDNLLLGEDGTLRVIDFGLAYAVGQASTARSADLTIDGAAPGTTLYMSPQQALHQPVERAFDVYAVGVILYELLSGRAPHAGRPAKEVLALRSSGGESIPSLQKVARQTPADLVALAERCMAYEPSERPSAEELLAFFEGLTRPRALELVEDSGGGVAQLLKETGEVAKVAKVAKVVATSGARGRKVAWAVIAASVVGMVVSIGASGREARRAEPLFGAWTVPVAQVVVPRESVEPAPEPVAREEDEVVPEPTPQPPAKPTGRRGGVRKKPRKVAVVPPSPPASDPPSCEARRDTARAGRAKKAWREVLASTSDAGCWPNTGARTRLRTEAFLRLGRYKQCFKQAFGSLDPDVVGWGEACYRKIDGAKQ